jgi:O-antigen/teichoic acid export membrane protein
VISLGQKSPRQYLQLVRGETALGALGSFGFQILASALGLATSILLARWLGADGYGLYSYAFAWVSVLSVPAVFGLSALLVREVAANQQRSAWGRTRGLLRWADFRVLSLSVSLAVLAAVVFWYTTGPGTVSAWALVLALIALPFNALASLRQSALRGLRRVIVAQLPDRVIRPLLVLVLVVSAALALGDTFNALWAIGAAVAAAVAAYGVGAWSLRRVLPEAIRQARPESDGRIWLRSAMSFVFISGMFVVHDRADVIMLGILRDSAAIGVYSVAARGAMLIGFVLGAVHTALAPSLSRHFTNGDLQRLRTIMRQSTGLVFASSVPVALVLLVFGKQFLSIFGAEFVQGYAVLVILSAAQLINAATGPVGQLLNMTGHEKDTAMTVGVSAALNIGLNLALIPQWGPVGAAAATACSVAFWNVGLAVSAYRRFGFVSLCGVVNIARTRSGA